MRNLYKVLGIASTADDQRIKSAFRRRAMKTHPDLNPGSKHAEERFRELMQAYQVLRDAQMRAAYDGQLARRRSESRRRFVQSAAVMAATFLLTTTSAIFAVGLQGISVHSETWQIATAWLTSVKVEGAADEPSDRTFGTTVITRTPAGQADARTDARVSPTAAKAAPRARSLTAARAQDREKVAAASRRTTLAGDGRHAEPGARSGGHTSEPDGRQLPTYSPYFGLGASGLQ
ncbi:MAG TPA: J domain-containing protein [Hyphomicrobiaceae bacterium]